MKKIFVLGIMLVLQNAWGSSPVLIIGDSHIVGGLGRTLELHFVDEHQTVIRFALVGSNPIQFLAPNASDRTLASGAVIYKDGQSLQVQSAQAMPLLSDLLTQYKPRLVIMEFGDNMADYADFIHGNNPVTMANADSFIRNEIKAIKQPLQANHLDGHCVFISPALVTDSARKSNTRVNAVVQIEKQTMGSACHFISTPDQIQHGNAQWLTSDGLHFKADGYKLWGDGVWQVLNGLGLISP